MLVVDNNKFFFNKKISFSELVLERKNKKFFIELFIDPISHINKIRINDNYYNLRVYKEDNCYNVFFRGYFAQVNLFREIEYNSFKNLPKTTFEKRR